jgi:hypothetical protein
LPGHWHQRDMIEFCKKIQRRFVVEPGERPEGAGQVAEVVLGVLMGGGNVAFVRENAIVMVQG